MIVLGNVLGNVLSSVLSNVLFGYVLQLRTVVIILSGECVE